MTQSEVSDENSAKRSRHRSPNYPAYDLSECVERCQKIYEAHSNRPVPLPLLAKTLGLSEKSSSLGKTTGALGQFGLIDEQGRGSAREIALSSRALDIIDPGGVENRRSEAVRKAALTPSIHLELWEKFDGKLPASDDEIRYYLTRTRDEGLFNANTVEQFISQFRRTLSFAEVAPVDTDDQSGVGGEQNDESTSPTGVDVGDLVQWSPGGVMQFATPARLTSIDELNGQEFGFVEGVPTGMPLNELSRWPIDDLPPESTQTGSKRDFTARPSPRSPNGATERITLDEGVVELHWPGDLSADSVEDLESWFEVVLRRMRRKAKASELVPPDQRS